MKEYLDCFLREDSSISNYCLNAAMGDFQSGQVCKSYNDLTYCSSNEFGKNCGYGITPLICNMLQKDFQAQDDQDKCQWFDCSKPFPFNGTFI